VHDVPNECLLRQVGIRVMSTKPSSRAVERLWNSFGDNLTAKRSFLLNDTLQMFVNTKMNHWVLQFDGVDATIEQLEYSFSSVLEFADEMIENELAVQVVETPAVQDVDFSESMSDGSGTDDVEDWQVCVFGAQAVGTDLFWTPTETYHNVNYIRSGM
jgi:hypothetical protein